MEGEKKNNKKKPIHPFLENLRWVYNVLCSFPLPGPLRCPSCSPPAPCHLFSLYNPEFSLCFLYAHGCRTVHWSMGNKKPEFWRKLTVSSSHQLPIALSEGGALWVSAQKLLEFDTWVLCQQLQPMCAHRWNDLIMSRRFCFSRVPRPLASNSLPPFLWHSPSLMGICVYVI